MRKFTKMAIAALAILPAAGCAIPPALSIASLVADGASFMSSGKSVTDHGISVVFDQDCALLRIFDGEICRKTPEYETAVATLEPQSLEYGTSPVVAAVETEPLAGSAPVLAVSAEPLGRPFTRPVERMETKPLTVASSSVGDPLILGADPLRGLEFRPDLRLAVPAVRIGQVPQVPQVPRHERERAALAGLQAQGTGLEADG